MMSPDSSKLPTSMAFLFSSSHLLWHLSQPRPVKFGLLWEGFTCLPSPNTLTVLLCLLGSFALWRVTSLEFTPGLFPPALSTFPGEALAHLILCWSISSPYSIAGTLWAAGFALSLPVWGAPPWNVSGTSNWAGSHADGWPFLSSLSSSVFLHKENSLFPRQKSQADPPVFSFLNPPPHICQ